MELKLKVTYLPGEEKAAFFIASCVKAAFPGAKIKESCQHPPYRHIYIRSQLPEVSSEVGKD